MSGLIRLAASAVLTALVLAACAPRPEPESESDASENGDDAPPGTDPAGQGAGTLEIAPGVMLRLTVDPPAPAAGAPVAFGLVLRNDTADELVVDFPDGQRFDFEVSDAGSVVWRWAADMFFPQVLGRERIAAGEEISWSASVAGGFPVGSYAVRGTLTSNTPREVVARFDIVEGDGSP